ncbi:MAG TPA: acyl-CoA dehydrogenase family protein [Saprospiraceae bacterium]|nr:acyl-CoA dehydrogenase family protein [Saprospiraceae bacterium]
MSQVVESVKVLKGSEFIVDDQLNPTFFIPERMDEEQRMIKEMVESFVRNEVWSVMEKIEEQEEGLSARLMEKLGELGLLGSHMPEEYGGMNLDFNTNSIISEAIGPSGSFSVSYNAHTGIGMLPVLYYGTKQQKEKYLPKLISGEWKACYCLTEPGSGSDALAAKSRADLSEDKTHYILNGQKMWISNAGWADVFTVFAKVDGDKFTAFILEKGMPGLTLGAEEKKMGIKGSSTRQVFMENVWVPVENVLGQIGRGHVIAFNVLNIGRYKLGASCLGGAKKMANVSIRYANERVQFNQPISTFGAIQSKIADQVIACFMTESAMYRCSHLINEKIKALVEDGKSFVESKLQAAEEYALECSIIKIIGSETLDFVVDEAMQIHGGMGYSEEGTVARAYRDSRINRIFEGTNEINKMVIINTIFKRAMSGSIDLVTPAMKVQSELMSGKLEEFEHAGMYKKEYDTVIRFKKLLQLILGAAGNEAMQGKINLKEEQELLMSMADLVIEVYNAESLLLRVVQLNNTFTDLSQDIYGAILKSYLYDASHRMLKSAFDAVGIFTDSSMHGFYAKKIKMLTHYPIQNNKELKRAIAAPFIAANAYIL